MKKRKKKLAVHVRKEVWKTELRHAVEAYNILVINLLLSGARETCLKRARCTLLMTEDIYERRRVEYTDVLEWF